MKLALVVFEAILGLTRPPAVDVIAERPRLEEMAQVIAEVVEERDVLAHWLPGVIAPLPVVGPRAREASAMALVSIAYGESRFAGDVADCSARRGYARTTYQLLGWWARGPYSWAELCASPRLAAERALWVLSHQAARVATPLSAFRGYAEGDAALPSPTGEAHCRRWERLCAAAGIRASCTSREVE